MVQQTSLLAFAQLIPKKALMQRKVMDLLKERGPMTNKEVSRALGWEINRVTGRMNELAQAGTVRGDVKRLCRITGRSVS